MAKPAKVSLNIYRGDSEAWTFRFYADAAMTIPYDLTGGTGKAQIRDLPGGVLLVELDVTITEPNQVDVSLDAGDSAALTAKQGVWDLEVTAADGTVNTLAAGAVFITADVTTLVSV